MVEIPADVATEEISELDFQYEAVKSTCAGGNPRDVADAARVLVQAVNPVIYAGQGVLYAEAWEELAELAELLQVPVMTTLEGKSAFPEHHPLSLGTGAGVMTRPALHFLRKADVVFGIECSFTRHGIVSANIPVGKVIIHATIDERDINKHYATNYPILGDAKLVLRQLLDALRDLLGGKKRQRDDKVAAEVKKVKEEWLSEWMPKLTSKEVPINPYRVIWEFMHEVDSREAIITHDAGSPRNQMAPFYGGKVTPRLFRMGQVSRSGDRTGPYYGGQAGSTGQVLREFHGRCRLRDDGAGLRNCCAQRNPHPHHCTEQLVNGCRNSSYGYFP